MQQNLIKFRLFKKSDKFFWSANNIVYPILIILCAIAIIKNGWSKIPVDLFDHILMWMFVITLLIAGIIKVVNFSKKEVLKGNFNGYIFFGDESIEINEREIELDTVEKIEFICNDYNGKHIFKGKGDLGPSLSNGTDNIVTIYFQNNGSEEYQFEVVNYYDFIEIKPVLVSYCKNGKLDFDTLAGLLREKSKRDLKYLRAEIER